MKGSLKRAFWPVVAGLLVLVGLDVIEARYVLAPLMGLVILRFGLASLGQLAGGGGAHIPEGDPQPVDTRVERVTYWCAGCGAELLLLVRGAATTPPRHCGERMTERREVARNLN
jgi:hypothetical protein